MGLIGGRFVEDMMTTDREYLIVRANMVTGLTKFGIFRQTMKRLIEFGQVLVSLLVLPCAFGENCNAFQIGSGCGLDPN